MGDGDYYLVTIFMASVFAVSMLMLHAVVMFAQLLSYYVRLPLPMMDVLLSASIVTSMMTVCMKLGLRRIMRCAKYARCSVAILIAVRLAIHVIAAALFLLAYAIMTLVAIAWLQVSTPLGLAVLLVLFRTVPASIRSMFSNAEGWVYTIRLYHRIRRESVAR